MFFARLIILTILWVMIVILFRTAKALAGMDPNWEEALSVISHLAFFALTLGIFEKRRPLTKKE